MQLPRLLIFMCAGGARVTGMAIKKGPVTRALKKMRGVSVSAEYNPPLPDLPTASQLELLSLGLRKGNCATLWTPCIDAVSIFAEEQKSARGDFPGPCPVVYNGDAEHLQAAVDAGAMAVVLDAAHLNAGLDRFDGIEIIWRVTDASEVSAVLEAGRDSDAFCFAASDPAAEGILAALPDATLSVATLEVMQEDDAEIACGKQLAEGANCRSLLLQKACVGDDEDVEYTRYAIEGLTSKASSTFKIDGMTGAVNGHFGTGGSARRRLSGMTGQWKRKATGAPLQPA
jgi:hypothetical protein